MEIFDMFERQNNNASPTEDAKSEGCIDTTKTKFTQEELIETEPMSELQNTESGLSYQEIDGRFVIGEPAGTFEQIPFMAVPSSEDAYHKSDLIADIAKMNNYLVMGASIRGESHFANKVVRQDSFVIDEVVVSPEVQYVIAVISDGVGNSSKSDQFSEFLVNYTDITLKETLNQCNMELINWDEVADKIWKASLGFCYQESGSKNISEYLPKWAGTLEFFIMDTMAMTDNDFVHVTVAGDGGAYLIDSQKKWKIIKRGKRREDNLISNTVAALPLKPNKIIVKKGKLQQGNSIFITTDGLGDAIEASLDVRNFIADQVEKVKNLPEFIRIVNVAIKQADDDKTGILIKPYV